MAAPPHRPDPPELQDPRLLEFARTIDAAPDSTIVPPRRVDTSGEHVLAEFETAPRQEDIHDRLHLGKTLGQGGMGIVRAAEQRSLGRTVAVKTLRPEVDPKDGGATLTIMREAWITGSLEHPNVVPIYDLGLDDDGRPLIVLKRIEGAAWSELMHRPNVIRGRFGATSALEWNIGVLIQVLNAIRFAHSKGVIHRDIKPHNVMIGPYGEVYLVDWGLALCLEEDETGRLPSRHGTTAIAGTPAYMAPEMLTGGTALSERSDIYLLGAVLYEIATGTPPHRGASAMAVIAQIAESDVDIPARVPTDLRIIIEHCLARDPADRYDDAEALAQALADYVEHRGSRRLSEEANRRLEIMRGYAAVMHVERDARGRDRLYDLYGECRFGFQAALDIWKDNRDARTKLDQATRVMIDFELAEGELKSAAALLSRMHEPPADLREVVGEAQNQARAHEEEIALLAERGRDESPEVDRSRRVVALTVIGVLFAAGAVGGRLFPNRLEYETLAAAPALMVLGIGVVAFFFRSTLLATRFNRRAASLVVTAGLSVPLLHVGTTIAGSDAVTSITHAVMLIASVAITAALVLDRRFGFSAALLVLVYFFSSRYPELRPEALAVGELSVVATAVWIWGGKGPRGADDG